MSTTRRSSSGPSGLHTNAPSSSRKSGSGAAASTPRRTSGNGKEDGSGLIVTRGLQEILDNDRRFRKPEEPPAMEKGHKTSKGQRRGSGQAPNFVMCYLCGRQFGTSSIDIHRPQCYLKKMIEWERGDPAIRGPKPMTPEAHAKMMKERVASATAASGSAGHPGASKLTGTAGARRANEIDLYNQIQMDAYNETALAPCPNCGRTFLPDRLQVHLRSCKPGSTARPVHRLSASSPSSPAAAPAATSGTNGAPKATSTSNAQERPIRVAGTRATTAAPAGGAGLDDVPPRTAGNESMAIRARGSYVMPEDAGAESVPPQAPSAKKPSRGPSTTSGLIASHRDASEAVTEEAEIRDPLRDAELEEVKPPSPRADTERRISSAAILRGDPEMSGSSAPNRPASMEPSTMSTLHPTSPVEDSRDNVSLVYAHSQSRGREHAAGSRPRRQGSTSAPRTAQMPELVSEPRAGEEGEEVVIEFQSDEDEPSNVPVFGADGQLCKVIECASQPGDGVQQSSSERRKWGPKKIPLNNVSRFKNVESRLKQQRTAELSMFAPCQYCGRTFVPERLQRHEECCADRHKPPAQRGVQLKARPSSAPASSTKPAHSTTGASSSASNSASRHSGPAPVATTKASPSPRAKPSNAVPAPAAATVTATSASSSTLTPGKAKFCGGCGVRVSADTQKFCTECGFKL